MMKVQKRDIVYLSWAAKALQPLIPVNHLDRNAVFLQVSAVSVVQKKIFGIRVLFAGKRKNNGF